jgi:LAS superfamily LD-carboxypeptidase LdcB
MKRSLIALGLSNTHLVSLSGGLCVDPDTAAAFEALIQRAADAGFDLRGLSAFRNYDRQNQIMNGKWLGDRPVTDAEGGVLERGSQPDIAWRDAILRFSALPGTSRHHWGTDLDVWDAAAVSEDYVPSLSPSEYEVCGPFADMTHWLDERIAADDAEGFFKPYSADYGGVAPEAWHISYRPVAALYEGLATPAMLLPLWQGKPDAMGVSHHPLAMLSVVESQAEALLERFVTITGSLQ